MLKKRLVSNFRSCKKGFTVLEVMLFLAITGLMLIGVLGGTYASINRQRYNDAVRSYADFLRSVYAEAISPQTNGSGNDSDRAIFGKVIFFYSKTEIYTATLVGDASKIPNVTSGFNDEIQKVMTSSGGIVCDAGGANSVQSYKPLWDSEILNTSGGDFTGAVVIARSPVSGSVHTVYINKNYGSLDSTAGCNSASSALRSDLAGGNFTKTNVNFCVAADGISPKQEVRLTEDGRNTSAIRIIGEADSDYQCK